MLTVLTIGTFDLLHLGHLRLLTACEKFGRVVVGVNSDDFVSAYKGKPPVLSEVERSAMLEELGYQTEINYSAGRQLIDEVRPNVLAVGSDWARKDYLRQIDVTQDWLDERSIMLLYIPYTPGISTTEIKRRLV